MPEIELLSVVALLEAYLRKNSGEDRWVPLSKTFRQACTKSNSATTPTGCMRLSLCAPVG